MKRIIFILFMAMAVNGLYAQQIERSSMTKKEKKQAEIEKQYQRTKQMIENKDFVLEADYLQNRFGHRFIVNSNINFVAVDSVTGIIQVGSDYRIGPNGVGGVTAKGNITNWVLKENKKSMSFFLRLTVMTSIGIYDLSFSIDHTGHAEALLTGLTAGQLTYIGNLVPYSGSSVYEGESR